VARQCMLRGYDGVISVTANVVPREMAAMAAAALAGDGEAADTADARLAGLHEALFLEANPIPVKWALAEMGRIGGGIRLPLTPLSAAHHAAVRAALARAGALTPLPEERIARA
jgi:4-hydroxy-tetrahydrodipicolinate synthase